MTRVFASIEEVRQAVGQDIGPSSWRHISQADVNTFADLTGDHQWIHVDAVRAAQSRFGATIAHGYLTLALIPAFNLELVEFRFGGARLNYGLNRVRFPTPVRVGEHLRASTQIVGVDAAAAGEQVTLRWTLTTENATRPACVAESVVLVTP